MPESYGHIFLVLQFLLIRLSSFILMALPLFHPQNIFKSLNLKLLLNKDVSIKSYHYETVLILLIVSSLHWSFSLSFFQGWGGGGGWVGCFSYPTSPARSPIGSVPCVPSYTLGSPAFKGVTRGMSFIHNTMYEDAKPLFVKVYKELHS